MREKNFEINGFAYRELYYFCLQYHEYKRGIEEILNFGSGKPTYSGSNSRGGALNKSDTENRAFALEKLKSKCELIEQTALEVDADIYQPLLKNVTTGVTYDHMKACDIEIFCGRRQFYEKRRKFFYLLNLKKG